jgi:hypothetical protein
LYRQVLIIITERHVRTAATPFNRYNNRADQTIENVAYAWQSGHRPIQQHTTYSLNGAFPDHLQPSLLRIYARVSGDWQPFLWANGVERPGHEQARHGVASAVGDSLTGEPSLRKRRLEDEEAPVGSSKLPGARKHARLASPPARIDPETSKDVQGGLSGAAGVALAAAYGMVDLCESGVIASARQQPSPPTCRETPPMIGPFVHLTGLDLLVCTQCKCAVLAAELKTHLLNSRHRRRFSKEERKSMEARVLNIPYIIKDQEALRQWAYPIPTSSPIPFLNPPIKEGLGCNTCLYVVREVRRMQQHCRQEHGWVNDWRKGGNVKQRAKQDRKPVPWRTGVHC